MEGRKNLPDLKRIAFFRVEFSSSENCVCIRARACMFVCMKGLHKSCFSFLRVANFSGHVQSQGGNVMLIELIRAFRNKCVSMLLYTSVNFHSRTLRKIFFFLTVRHSLSKAYYERNVINDAL